MVAAERPSSRRSSWSRRSGMLLRLVFRALTVRSGRMVNALSAIVVGAAVVTGLTCLYFDISIKMSEELRAYGANMMITPRQEPGTAPARRAIDVATLEAAAASMPADRLIGSSPFLYGLVRLDLGNAILAGVDFQELRRISPYWQVEGDWVSAAFDERNAMVGRRLAESMELDVGSPVTVVNRTRSQQVRMTVKGIVDTGEAEDEQIFVNLSLAQKLLDMPGKADFAMASIVAGGPEADALSRQLMARFPTIDARPIRRISAADGQILDKIEGLMALVALIILIITTLCVNATLTAMVAERAPEIGLQKAIGASDRSIVIQFMTETAAICLLAVVVGLGAGFLLAQALGQTVFGAWVSFRAVVVPLTLGLSLTAALLAAVLPVRRAVGVVPVRVLRGE